MQRSLDDRLIVKLNITEALAAEEALALGAALVRQLREDPLLQDARIDIEQMAVGSWWIHLLIILGTVGTLADSVPKLIDAIKAGEGPFGVLVAPTLDRHAGEICQVVSGSRDEIILRSQMTSHPSVFLKPNNVATSSPVLGTPTLNSARQNSDDGPVDGGHEENTSGFWPGEPEGREQTFLGSFRLLGENYFFDTGDRSYKVEGQTSDLPLESQRLVNGIVTSMTPPSIRVLAITRIFPDGSRTETVIATGKGPSLFERFVRDNLGTEVNIPRSNIDLLRGPQRRVGFVGAFERGVGGSYIFRREDSVTFEVWGVDPDMSLPLETRLYVVGDINAERPDLLEFCPVKMARID